LAARFDETRRAVLSTVRDPAALRDEVRAMREKLRAAHACPPELFDLKHSPGGMIDIEFAVQYLVLAHSHAHPELMGNLGNIAVLPLAEAAGLLPEGLSLQAGNAYRDLRRLQHRSRLDEAPTRLDISDMPDVAAHRAAVLDMWQHVFGHA
jgi:glutamate-ammonia-ligase adenylyltransferase